jgi:dTDP-4-amino-4,6-dideoxygalactose transaminase
MIPLVDLKAQYASIRADVDAALARVVQNTDFVLGREVRSFEEQFASACGAGHAVGIASGTAALHLALLASGIGPGDEVITTPLTFIATAEAIIHCGARPVFVDIDPNTLNIDPSAVEAAITGKTRAIVPVHLYGRVVDLDRFANICRARGLALVGDAAQAHLARHQGRPIATIGHASCFSFYPGKNLGAYGDAGMVVTNDADVARQVRLLRNHGREDKYVHDIVGYGERIDALQAAVLNAKLPHLAGWTERRQQIADAYRVRLGGLPLTLPAPAARDEHVYHLFVVRTPHRDALLTHLKSKGIHGGIHYPIPLHLQPALSHLGYREGDFPRAEAAAAEVASLPLYPELADAAIDEVANAVGGFFASIAREATSLG